MFICEILLYFLNSAHLICRSTDVSKCFNGSLRLRDNESRLYLLFGKTNLSNDENTLLFRAVHRYIKIQRGLYRQPYTKVHTVREQNGGSQSLLDRSSFSFISPLFSFSCLSFFFFFFVFRRHFCYIYHFCACTTCEKWSPCRCFAKVPSTLRRRCFAVVLMQIYLCF